MLYTTVPLYASAEDGFQVCRHLARHDIDGLRRAALPLLTAQGCLHCGARKEGLPFLQTACILICKDPVRAQTWEIPHGLRGVEACQ